MARQLRAVLAGTGATLLIGAATLAVVMAGLGFVLPPESLARLSLADLGRIAAHFGFPLLLVASAGGMAGALIGAAVPASRRAPWLLDLVAAVAVCAMWSPPVRYYYFAFRSYFPAGLNWVHLLGLSVFAAYACSLARRSVVAARPAVAAA